MKLAPTDIRDVISRPITDLKSAKLWICGLIDSGLSYHFDDSPETVVCHPSDEPIFTAAECPILRERIQQLYTFNWGRFDCPIGFLLYIENQNGDEE